MGTFGPKERSGRALLGTSALWATLRASQCPECITQGARIHGHARWPSKIEPDVHHLAHELSSKAGAGPEVLDASGPGKGCGTMVP